MKALNKQALREAANAANIASWGKWESYKPHKGARGYEVKVGAKAVAQHCLKVDSAFIAAANPPPYWRCWMSWKPQRSAMLNYRERMHISATDTKSWTC